MSLAAATYEPGLSFLPKIEKGQTLSCSKTSSGSTKFTSLADQPPHELLTSGVDLGNTVYSSYTSASTVFQRLIRAPAAELDPKISFSPSEAVAREISSLSQNGLGVALTGFGLKETLSDYKKACSFQDTDKIKKLGAKLFKAGSEIAQSASSFLHEALSFFSTSNLPSSFLSSLLTISIIGSAGSALATLSLATYRLYQTILATKKFLPFLSSKNPLEVNEGYRRLVEMSELKDAEKEKIKKTVLETPSKYSSIFSSEALEKALKNPNSENLKKIIEYLPEKSSFELLQIQYPETITSLEDKELYSRLLSALYEKKCDVEIEKKTSTLIRFFGSNTLKAIKEEKSPEIVASVALLAIKKTIALSVVKMIGALAISTLVVLAQLASGGSLLLAETTLSLAVSFCTTMMIAYKTYQSFSQSSLPFTKKLLKMASLLGICCITTAAAIGSKLITNVSSLAILMSAWFTIPLIIIYAWTKKEARAEKPEESIEYFNLKKI